MSGLVAKCALQKITKSLVKSHRRPFSPVLFLRSYYTVKRKIKKDENFLSKHLCNKMKAKGPITIADYMKEVLQNPMRGYYMSKDMFGELGDFITSPEITQIFGEMLAVWFLNEWQKLGCPRPLQIVELGPGRGTLMADILKVFSHFKALHNASLSFVEISPILSDIQARTICIQSNNNPKGPYYKEGITRDGIRVYWYKQVQDITTNAFTLLLAHEFFDALPIHKFHKTYAGYKEVLVDLENGSSSEDIKFRYVLARHDTPMLKVLLKPTETREHVEISPDSLLIYEHLCKRIVNHGGIALICDYGHDGTGTDTFRAFKKHQQVDPLVLPGTADLTADVDFNCIREVANQNENVIFLGPTKQRSFLQRIGIEYRVNALLENMKDKKQIENLQECYNFLTDESKMGKRFKFCALVPASVKKIIERYPVVGF